MTDSSTPPETDRPMRFTYLRVIAVEMVVLLALWFLQLGFNR